MPANIIIGYNQNDFFYVKAKEDEIMPSEDTCNTILTEINSPGNTWTDKCSDVNIHTSDNAIQCTNKELCRNKDSVGILYNLQNNKGGVNQKYLDTKKKYNDELLNTLNLGIGIIILGGFIYSKYI